MAPANPAAAVWLVDGDDETLIAEALRQVVEDLVGDQDRGLVLEDFRGDEVDCGLVADACQTPPFLSDSRVVVLRQVGRFSSEELAPLLEYLEHPLDTTRLVLSSGGGRMSAKLNAAVKAKGQIRATTVSNREAKSWVRTRLAEAPFRIDAPGALLIESHLGEDVSRLPALIEVLTASFGPGASVGAAEVEPYLGQAGAVAPWDFTDAVDGGRSGEAIRMLHKLMEGGGRHPLVILSILHRHISNLLKVDSPEITSEAAAAKAMGIAKGRSTFPAKKALTSARRYGSAGIAQAIGLLADAEADLKGASSWPPELVLEVLVGRLAGIAGRRR